MAEQYTALNDASMLNEHYNRPAIRRLLGDVRGHRVLDVGCGSGPNLIDLLADGAEVVGVDGSPAMVEIARKRLGPDVDVRVADAAEPLPFETSTFDDVVCSLTLHYLRDWSEPLAQMHRVLKPGGKLVISVEHPFAIWYSTQQDGKKSNYFATRPRQETEMAGVKADLTFWDRSLTTMVSSFLESGFRITAIEEPAPADSAISAFPEMFRDREDPRFLAFLFFVLEA
jgi:SAM-dependent methyltransferase